MIYHEHIFYYSLLSAIEHFKRHDMVIFDVKLIPIHAGSLRFYVCKKDSYHARSISESVKLLAEEERSKGYDNFEIFVNGIRVGLVRFSYSQATTYLRDIQLEGEYQGKGVGSKVLQLIKLHGQSRGSKRLALRVFSENPVINLYKTMGFMQLAEVDGLVEMQLLLNAPVD
jgi:GNAT superfamily N-acetyltransferase